MMAVEEWSQPDEQFATDACLVGAGGWCQGQYFHCVFPEKIAKQSLCINALELLTIIVGVKLWAHLWKGKRIIILCDNKVSVDVINMGRARDKFLLKCLRELVYLAAVYEFEIRAKHIAGVSNRLPDLLSRWSLSNVHEKQFHSLTAGIDTKEVIVNDSMFHFSHDW